METIYVLDTCIILGDPELRKYQGKTVYIPIAVQRELDRQKTLDGDVGFKSRVFFRRLKDVKDLKGEFFHIGEAKVLNPTPDLEALEDGLESMFIDKADDWFEFSSILNKNEYMAHTADFSLYNLLRLANKNVEFVNKNNRLSVDRLYSGKIRVKVSHDVADRFKTQGYVDWKDDEKPYPNQFVILDANGYEQYGRYHVKQDRVVQLVNGDNKVWGLKARNAEQKYLMDVLMDDNVKIVSVSGQAGTGKSIVALASALYQVVDKRKYRKLYIAKDCTPIDKWNYLGFTTGSTSEKLEQHFLSYKATLESLASDKGDREINGSKILEGLVTFGHVELLDIASIRGVTFRNSIVIVDEFQSMNLDTAQAIVSRIGDGAKIIFMGDLLQQTVDKLPPDKSGLFAVAEWLKSLDNTAHITLKKVERSEIVEKVVEIFTNKLYGGDE